MDDEISSAETWGQKLHTTSLSWWVSEKFRIQIESWKIQWSPQPWFPPWKINMLTMLSKSRGFWPFFGGAIIIIIIIIKNSPKRSLCCVFFGGLFVIRFQQNLEPQMAPRVFVGSSALFGGIDIVIMAAKDQVRLGLLQFVIRLLEGKKPLKNRPQTKMGWKNGVITYNLGVSPAH